MDDQVIIKRIKKVVGGGHHGGAWKVAYADFVTAMMAFFLLLWLINTTTPEQKLGLAEYFTPTVGIKDSKGIGFRGGKRPTEEGNSRTDLTTPGLVIGQAQQGPAPGEPTLKSMKSEANAESTSLAEKPKDIAPEGAEEAKTVEQEIKQAVEQDPDLVEYKKNIIVQDTPEGLKIDMIDDPAKPMFVPGGAQMTENGKKILDSMSRIIIRSPNNIAISGHTDSGSMQNPQYGTWELSADRAQSARRFLSTTQLEPERVMKVTGLADRELLTPQEPTNPRNRRISIIMLRNSYFHDPKAMPTTRTLLTVPDAKVKPEEEKKDESIEEQKPIEKIDEKSMFNPSNTLSGR